jgi:hypothetical protein
MASASIEKSMSARHLFLSLVLSIAPLGLHGQAATGPDPKLLLQGIESMREQTPPACLQIRVEYDAAFAQVKSEHIVLFEGERRYFIMTNSGRDIRILYDGTNVLRYDGQGSIIVRSLDSQVPDYLFDPRTLGLEGAMAWGTTVQNSLHLNASRMELVGREQTNGLSSWHVRLFEDSESGKCEINFWIDDKNGFAVYRADEKWGNGSRTTRSYYENPAFPWIPNRIEGEEYDAKGQLRRKQLVRITAAALKDIPASTWTMESLMAGLQLQEWLPVTDVRIPKQIGYWHKGRLGPSTPWADKKPVPPKPSTRRYLVCVLMTLLLLLPMGVLFFKRKSRLPA